MQAVILNKYAVHVSSHFYRSKEIRDVDVLRNCGEGAEDVTGDTWQG